MCVFLVCSDGTVATSLVPLIGKTIHVIMCALFVLNAKLVVRCSVAGERVHTEGMNFGV
jgi:hypothetical protein